MPPCRSPCGGCRARRVEPMVQRATARGELPADTDPGLLHKALIAPIYLPLLVTSEAIDEQTAEHAVQIALAAARAGVLRRPVTAGARTLRRQ
ncbi:MAG TPA: TetR-like C-terminal domain-containing protein [Micromonospora sp.]